MYYCFVLQDKLRYSFDTNTADATERSFLYVDPENGIISLKKLFTTTTLNKFTVRLVLSQWK
jgi:hypothetical protein